MFTLKKEVYTERSLHWKKFTLKDVYTEERSLHWKKFTLKEVYTERSLHWKSFTMSLQWLVSVFDLCRDLPSYPDFGARASIWTNLDYGFHSYIVTSCHFVCEWFSGHAFQRLCIIGVTLLHISTWSHSVTCVKRKQLWCFSSWTYHYSVWYTTYHYPSECRCSSDSCYCWV